MTEIRGLHLLHLLLIGFMAGLDAPSSEGADRPNVLIVMTDDQGYGDFSAHGNPILKTPHLDKLRCQSIRFTDFHVAPMCTPTRGQLMTGLDAVRNGATSVTAGRSFVRPGIPMMPEIFSQAGYRTGLFGKWHLGDNYPHRPNDRGFHEAMYHLGWGITAAPEFSNSLSDGRYFHNGASQKFAGHCTDFWFDQAMRWMKSRQDQREPFLCYLPTNAPHAPHDVDEKYSRPFGDHPAARFYGMITQIDENIGKLDEFLRSSGLIDNTIVIFMTDNGGTAGVKTFNAGMRAGKTTYYEGGHRVPCWIRWPAGQLVKPKDVPYPSQNQDILPTLLELCGVSKPASVTFDGDSLVPLLRGKGMGDRLLVVQYGQQVNKFESCVIWNQFRLVKGTELYDLASDPAQERNVAADHPSVISRMREYYEHWWSGVEPGVNDFVTTTLGAPQQPIVPLTSSDWENIYADNSNHIRQGVGGPQGGHWNVTVARGGTYEITVRRWPADTGAALGAALGEKSKAFPIAGAKLSIGDQLLTATTNPQATAVSFKVTLQPGKYRLKSWFQNATGDDLCGAYFADVKGP